MLYLMKPNILLLLIKGGKKDSEAHDEVQAICQPEGNYCPSAEFI